MSGSCPHSWSRSCHRLAARMASGWLSLDGKAGPELESSSLSSPWMGLCCPLLGKTRLRSENARATPEWSEQEGERQGWEWENGHKFPDSYNRKFPQKLQNPGPNLWQCCFMSSLDVSFLEVSEERNLARLIIHSLV